MDKLLIVHTGGIGDFILTFPAIQRLHLQYEITVAGERERMDLAVHFGLAAYAVDLNSIDFHSIFTSPSPRLVGFLQQFDASLLWLRDDDGFLVQTLRGCGVRDAYAFPGLPPQSWTQHATEYFHGCIERLFSVPLRADLPLQALTGINLRRAASAPIVIHPGSGDPKKNWPMERLIEIYEHLIAQGFQVQFILGPAEEERLQLPSTLPRLPRMTLVQLAEGFTACALYIGNDSGITHLAAHAGVPVIALFRSTNPLVWAPLGERVVVVAFEQEATLEELLVVSEG